MRALLVLLFRGAAISVLTVACGGDNPPPESDGPPASPVNRRLAWTQEAPSLDEVRRYSFLLYVNDQRAVLGDQQCDTGATTSRFECSGRLPTLAPGSYSLKLSAVVGERESGQSDPLTLSMPLGRESLETPLAESRSEALPAPACTAGQSVCYDLQPVLTFDRPVSAPAAAPDGRLFFIEDGRRVRVIAGGRLVAEPALAVEPSRRLIALLLEPRFVQGGGVYLAWVEASNAGQRRLTVAKYREVDGRLGEGRVVISDLALPSSGDPRVAQDDAGHLYVALPGEVGTGVRRPDPYQGALLRFTGDGMTPWESGQTSPVFAQGQMQPAALALDAAANRVWMGGRDANQQPVLDWIGTAGTAAPRPAPRVAARSERGDSDLMDIAVVSTGRENEPGYLVTVDAAGVLARLPLGASGLNGPPETIATPSGVVPVAVSAGRSQDVYLIVRESMRATGAHSILRLSPKELR